MNSSKPIILYSSLSCLDFLMGTFFALPISYIKREFQAHSYSTDNVFLIDIKENKPQKMHSTGVFEKSLYTYKKQLNFKSMQITFIYKSTLLRVLIGGSIIVGKITKLN